MALSSGVSVEPLETRLLMAVTVTLSRRGRLNIVGDAGSDVVEVAPFNGKRDVQVFINGVLTDPTPRGPATFVQRNRIRRIVADMGAGDDEVYVGRRKTDPLPFRNRLFARCTLVGGEGNDILQGGPLADLIIGGAGDDILTGDRGDDVIFGGSGNDQISGEGGRDNLIGQDGNDRLNGGGNEDALYGMAGADDLVGAEDNDFLNPGPGPGDTHDHNDRPDAGQQGDATAYVEKLITIGVPQRFRAAARS